VVGEPLQVFDEGAYPNAELLADVAEDGLASLPVELDEAPARERGKAGLDLTLDPTSRTTDDGAVTAIEPEASAGVADEVEDGKARP